jgi:signal transduction histidine kinase
MDKERLITTLFELSMIIKPETPEKLLKSFLTTVSKKFEFSYAFAEVPRLNLEIEIPRKGRYSDLISFEKKVSSLRFGRLRKIPEEYVSVLDPIIERLDFMLDYVILTEERYKKMIEHSGDLIMLIDKNGEVVEANPSAINVLGDVIGKKVWDRWLNNFVDNFEYKGKYYSVAHYNILGLGKQIVARDITDRVKLEKTLSELNDILRLLNKILRHDILNDLSALRAAVEFYIESRDESLLESVLERIDRSISLIKQMRELEDLTRFRETKPVRVGELLDGVVKKYAVKINVDGDGIVMANEALSSVFDNLIGNAVKHGKADRIDIKIERKNDFYEIRIADNGMGIAEEIKDVIFEEGFSYGEGSGLGLYISKKIIESYDGSIELESTNPTVFVIRLRAGR